MKAVFFDADSVIVRPESWFFVAAERDYGIPKAAFLEFVHTDLRRCTRGELELLEILPAYLARWQVRVSAEELVQAWLRHEHHLDHTLLEQIQTIRRAGMPCYLATNQERNRASYMKKEMGLEAALDGVFISSELGARKPEPAFYHKVQNALNLEPHEIYFWDDSSENVQAALECGWQAQVFTLPTFAAWFGESGIKNFVSDVK
jgi:putative hydrolase of the HAD superfamily